jgi:hypothetical protein
MANEIPALEGKYAVTMDIWPMETREFTRIYEFYDNLNCCSCFPWFHINTQSK